MNPAISDWRGQRVWLLGASSGIGAALAKSLLERGARVALSARSADGLAAVADGHRAAMLLPCDVTNADSLSEAWETLLANFGGVDLALYVAGDYKPMRAWAIDTEAARKMIDVNLVGAIAFAAHVVPQLIGQAAKKKGHGGQIAFVASVAGYRGLPKSLIYGPTKAALINFAEVLHLDLAPRGIGVFLINPGFVATPLTAQNDFAMPALQTPVQAAGAIVDGFASGAFEIHFPKRFTRVLKLLQWLPRRVYFALVRRATGL